MDHSEQNSISAPEQYHPGIEPGIIHPPPSQSASPTLSWGQFFFGGFLLASLIFFLVTEFVTMIFYINAAMLVAYLALTLYKFVVIQASIQNQENATVVVDISELKDDELPKYTILIPLHKEMEQVEGMVKHLSEMDYPQPKMEVMFLLEESDVETVEYCRAFDFPDNFKVIVVPPSKPQTKPKACNYGLVEATGEYLVIYDAEDRPEKDQLKKALAGFKQFGEEVVCLQARLNFYNSNFNWLTKWFTADYSTWFDLYLPGLNAFDAPIPLGGTSNHFKMSVLRELAGWDAFNVAEDCDLGMRLYRRGYRTRMLESTTWEEACSNAHYWILQRSRWIKGYMQTFLVHNRSPLSTAWSMGPLRYMHFLFLTGLTALIYLINPIYWGFALIWILCRFPLENMVPALQGFVEFFRYDVQEYFPASLFMMGFLCLFLGNFVFIYVNALGCVQRQRFDLIKWALLVPPYWVMMSIAAWRALIQLVIRPYYWDKTKHGLSGDNTHQS